jgi:hypothetical protein
MEQVQLHLLLFQFPAMSKCVARLLRLPGLSCSLAIIQLFLFQFTNYQATGVWEPQKHYAGHLVAVTLLQVMALAS